MTQSPNDGKAPKAGEEVGFAATMAMEAVDIPLDPASYASTLADTELPMSPEEIRALMSNPAQDETNALDNDSGATIPVSAEQAEAMLANLSAYDENAATAIVSPEQIAAAREHAGLVPNQPDDGRYTQIEASDKIAQYVEQAKAAQASYATDSKRKIAPTLAEQAVSGPQAPVQVATKPASSSSSGLIIAILLVALAILAGLVFIIYVAFLS